MLDADGKKKLVARLKRAEGQLAAVRRMVESDTYCVDVLTQIQAVRGALGRAGSLLLHKHVETCVADAMRDGDDEERTQKLDELMELFDRFGGLGR